MGWPKPSQNQMWGNQSILKAFTDISLSIIHIYLTKTLTSVYLLYTLFYLNNHFIFFFYYFNYLTSHNHFFTYLFFSLSLSLSQWIFFLFLLSLIFLHWSSFLLSPISSLENSINKLENSINKTKNLHFNINPCQPKSIWVGSGDGSKVDAAVAAAR